LHTPSPWPRRHQRTTASNQKCCRAVSSSSSSCFFSRWAAQFDFTQLNWLDKKVVLAPPAGERWHLHLVAPLRIRPDTPPSPEGFADLLALVDALVEARDRIEPLRPRRFAYYMQLRRDGQLPVLPIGLFPRVGLQGIGWDCYEESFWERRLLRFEYADVDLPALPAGDYATGEHLLGVALSALLRVPPELRAPLHAAALKRIGLSTENDGQRFLLAECLDPYRGASS
jgi:hypothetical protein